MESKVDSTQKKKLTIGGLFITLGVVYGDIGTSPLYVMKALIHGNDGLANISDEFIYGSLSLVFWTLTLLTTIKYVSIALRADNHGEGGIFSLYTLIRKKAKWLIVPAMIGGATLLADGILTPAVTVTTAVEGLRGIPSYIEHFGSSQNTVLLITIIIISFLFMIQRFGTEVIGRLFGPIMFLWFLMLAVLGVLNTLGNWDILRSLSPYYGIKLLLSEENKSGFLILGSIFLATTGAEALYSDLGHVGRKNIYASWPFVKLSLLLNYFGQGAWLLSVKDKPSFQHIEEINPFFEMMPASFRIIGVVFATLAAIIASQALISGSYTLVSEAIKLNLWPRLQIIYPTNTKGQLYIPVINSILWAACIGVVLYFRTSEHMEAAYGLAITITMLMTTILLYNYLIYRNVSHFISLIVLFFFGGLETMFFLSSATKLFHGGFVTVLIALIILSIMVIWHKAYVIEHNVAKEVSLVDHVSRLEAVKADYSIPLYATNLVYLTSKSRPGKVDSEVMYSIFDKQPKRAEVYWFINVEVTDEPRTMEYVVENFGTDSVIKVKLRLGFRMEQKISTYMRQVVIDLMKSGDINKQPQKWSINEFNRNVGDFCFVIVREELSTDTELSALNRFIMQTKLSIKKLAVSPVKWFGLEYTDVKIEHVPLLLGKRKKTRLKRVYS
ncbi:MULTISPECIES: KUP/HAK/KT family potassium transporter [Carnobacterium]|uniref:Probable potassium transport system protein Kup n=1 Tax=Carnobacterium inhibens subsp. gilichinskyi TaxID=1266845 RepID=U5S7M0_9LACT|nr:MULTISPECIES: KUP/HAK/KT family potassium transporter [Carnobacterium]AGY81061.1 potassium transporter Kup [Carnobacterium inhibens subsp. gilichinskyi]MCM3513356.1 KUP/HAK/KT family potassium transporter [Carnobacterium inhibens]MDN5372212.1 system potassium uptake protein [Carnobacterium sp.]